MTAALDRMSGGPRPSEEAEDESGVRLRMPLVAGLLVVGGFFGVLGGWAALAPLSSAAIAPGTVIVEGNRRTVQHLEGGIVREILVRDGDAVAAGQPLVILDDTQARATLDLVQGRRVDALAREARLVAEGDGREAISFPDELYDRAATDERTIKALDGQTGIFLARTEALKGQTEILRQGIAQYEEEIIGLHDWVEAEDKQLDLIDQEIQDVQTLLAKGLARRPRMLELRRRQAEIEGSRSQHVAEIARAKQRITEVRIRIRDLRTERLNEAVAELRTVQTELFDLEERYRAIEDVLRRITIRAPIGGVVLNLQIHTAGGVIAPGAPILEIVPEKEKRVIDARIDPSDIDVVQVGQIAQVRFPAFNQRANVPAGGTVTWISADRHVDEQSGTAYYRSRVELLDGSLAELNGKLIHPGMQADVLIVTGERTVLDYLVEPILVSINRAFREKSL